MASQKCVRLSLKEKNSLDNLLKHLVDKKIITKAYADEGRKIFGIQIGGGGGKDGIHANVNTNNTDTQPELPTVQSQVIRDVAQVGVQGMEMIRNAQPQGGNGGSKSDNNVINAQINNTQVVLQGIGQGRSAAELALFNPDPTIRAWGLEELKKQKFR